jgi:hypothetical protein
MASDGQTPLATRQNTILRPFPSGFLLQARTTSRPRAPVWQRAWSASDLRAMARIGSLTKSEFEEFAAHAQEDRGPVVGSV